MRLRHCVVQAVWMLPTMPWRPRKLCMAKDLDQCLAGFAMQVMPDEWDGEAVFICLCLCHGQGQNHHAANDHVRVISQKPSLHHVEERRKGGCVGAGAWSRGRGGAWRGGQGVERGVLWHGQPPPAMSLSLLTPLSVSLSPRHSELIGYPMYPNTNVVVFECPLNVTTLLVSRRARSTRKGATTHTCSSSSADL